MRIFEITNTFNKTNFRNNDSKKQNREFIDIIADNVKNPRDVKDCVAVPRGIFKAYIYLMMGSSLMLIGAALPNRWKGLKTGFNIGSAILSGISAVYFAKPFAVKGLSPTVEKAKIV